MIDDDLRKNLRQMVEMTIAHTIGSAAVDDQEAAKRLQGVWRAIDPITVDVLRKLCEGLSEIFQLAAPFEMVSGEGGAKKALLEVQKRTEDVAAQLNMLRENVTLPSYLRRRLAADRRRMK